MCRTPSSFGRGELALEREKKELDPLSKVQSQEQAGHPSRSEHGHSDGAVEERLGDEQKN